MIEVVGYGLITLAVAAIPRAVEEWEKAKNKKEYLESKNRKPSEVMTEEKYYKNAVGIENPYTGENQPIIAKEETEQYYKQSIENKNTGAIRSLIEVSPDGSTIDFYIPKGKTVEPIPFTFGKLEKDYIAVGHDEVARPILWDLKKIYHIYLGGITGAGKTTVLFYLIMQILRHGHTVQLSDLKEGLDHWVFENCQGVIEYTDNIYQTLTMIDTFNKITKERMAVIKAAGYRDYNKYIEAGHKMPRHFLVIDEVGDLMTLEKESKKGESYVEDIIEAGRKARAAGCHLILSTQRTCKDSFPTRLKANISAVVGMAAATENNSKILIDDAGCEKLGPHEALTTVRGKLEYMRAYFLNDKVLEAFCKSIRKKDEPRQQEPLVKNKFIKENK